MVESAWGPQEACREFHRWSHSTPWPSHGSCRYVSVSLSFRSRTTIEYSHDRHSPRIMSGFAGAIVSGGKGTAAAKFEALSAAGTWS